MYHSEPDWWICLDRLETVFNIWLVERVHYDLIFTQKYIFSLKKIIKDQKDQ